MDRSIRLSISSRVAVVLLVICGTMTGCCGFRQVSSCGGCGGGCGLGLQARCGGACGGATCGGGCGHIFQGEIASRLRNNMFGGCTSGCGEVYYDERINVPPTCDPCGCDGQFNGGTCGEYRPLLERLRSLLGPRYIAGCDSCSSCSQCGGSGSGYAAGYQNNGSGYCPSCNDGVAGSPEHYSHQSMDDGQSTMSMHQSSTPRPAKRPSQPQPVSKPSHHNRTAPAHLQPVPDATDDGAQEFDRPVSVLSTSSNQVNAKVRSSSHTKIATPKKRPSQSRLVAQ